jgi:hypothetical protein
MSDTTPMAENRTLPRRQPNAAYRQREYLTETEVERLIEAARKRGRNSTRIALRYYLRIGMDCERLSSVSFAGLKSICAMGGCM